jgi:hypothetical protein
MPASRPVGKSPGNRDFPTPIILRAAAAGWETAKNIQNIFKNLVKNRRFGQKPAKSLNLGCFPQPTRYDNGKFNLNFVPGLGG